MDEDIYSSGNQVDGKVLQTFQKSFVQVQDILDQNRILINEINQNHESKIPDNLSRNVVLIRELNSNIRRVVDLYSELSSSFTNPVDVSSEGDSSGTFKSNAKGSQKRIRSGMKISRNPNLKEDGKRRSNEQDIGTFSDSCGQTCLHIFS